MNGKNYICTKFVRSQKFCREMNCDESCPEECGNQWVFFFFFSRNFLFVTKVAIIHRKVEKKW